MFEQVLMIDLIISNVRTSSKNESESKVVVLTKIYYVTTPSDYGISKVLRLLYYWEINHIVSKKFCMCGFLCQDPFVPLTSRTEIFIVVLDMDHMPHRNNNYSWKNRGSECIIFCYLGENGLFPWIPLHH